MQTISEKLIHILNNVDSFDSQCNENKEMNYVVCLLKRNKSFGNVYEPRTLKESYILSLDFNPNMGDDQSHYINCYKDKIQCYPAFYIDTDCDKSFDISTEDIRNKIGTGWFFQEQLINPLCLTDEDYIIILKLIDMMEG